MHDYKGFSIPDHGDKNWDQQLVPFMTTMIDYITSTQPAISGSVFCTNVSPVGSGNVYGKEYLDGYAISSVISTCPQVTVTILATSGASRIKPTITINGVEVTNLTGGLPDIEWTGSAIIDVPADGNVIIHHIDGDSYSFIINSQAAPKILSAEFTGNYPGIQTELKQWDPHSITVTADVDFVTVEISNYGAFQAQSYAVSSGTSATVVGSIANRGNVATLYGAMVRVKDQFGTWSDYFTTSGSIEHVNVVLLNDLYPSASIGAIAYPGTQKALKDAEIATFTLNCSNYDTISITSPTGELDVSSVDVGSTSVSRISGNYNTSTVNIRVTLTRVANGSSNSAATTVAIANIAPTLSVSSPSRMRSALTAQSYSIGITASQALLFAPTLQPHTGNGSFTGLFGGSGSSWNAPFQITDSSGKGTFNWGAISATGLSGISTSTITSGLTYTLGGFLMRTFLIPAWPTRSIAIGCVVVDTSKLRCTNLSKGASGSLNFTYQATTTDAANSYTITAGNSTWYNCDLSNAVSNSSGTMQIELEELA
jgi:hypothetical protein